MATTTLEVKEEESGRERRPTVTEQPQAALERYDHKVEEMGSIGLISALLFGFILALWIEFDEQVFATQHDILAYLFDISAILTLVTSALSTVIAITTIVAFRRLMFKYGKETDYDSLRLFKRRTHHVRNQVRLLVVTAIVGLFLAVAVYAHAKWNAIIDTSKGLFVITYGVIVIGFGLMVYSYWNVRSAYAAAMKLKENNPLTTTTKEKKSGF